MVTPNLSIGQKFKCELLHQMDKTLGNMEIFLHFLEDKVMDEEFCLLPLAGLV